MDWPFISNKAIMSVRCYGQSSYKYQICIGARMLICKDRLRDRVVVRLPYGMD